MFLSFLLPRVVYVTWCLSNIVARFVVYIVFNWDGDDIVICDANFTAVSHGQRLVRLDGASAPQVLKVVLSIMPLDRFVKTPMQTIEVVADTNQVPPIIDKFKNIVQAVADYPATIKSVERFGFYEQAKQAFAIIQTGEQQLYGNIILKKGVAV